MFIGNRPDHRGRIGICSRNCRVFYRRGCACRHHGLINAPATQDMAGKMGNDCIGIVGDVTKSSDIQRATQTARDLAMH